MTQPTAMVVGAGVFGAASALELATRGWSVTLVEQAAPGHVHASSGGESRLLRCGHGDDVWHARSARRAHASWLAVGEAAGVELFVPCGVAWFAHRDDGWEAASERVLRDLGIPVERLSPDEAAGLFPQLGTGDLRFVLLEPEAGVLRARRAVGALTAQARAAGARLERGRAEPDGDGLRLEGRRRRADRIVWACGPWLAKLFGDLVSLRVTKQDELYFAAQADWRTPTVPAWVDYDLAAYGLGDLDGRGVKCAADGEGPEFDPDLGERIPSPENVARARAYLARRFPSLATAPLSDSRTCQYELTTDTRFLLDRHPDHDEVWLFGGGSGHGFKHAPALAVLVADLLEGRAEPDPRFALGRRDPSRSLRTAGGFSLRHGVKAHERPHP